MYVQERIWKASQKPLSDEIITECCHSKTFAEIAKYEQPTTLNAFGDSDECMREASIVCHHRGFSSHYPEMSLCIKDLWLQLHIRYL